MKALIAVAAAVLLAGCGADVATSAATAAQLKKQELEQGQQTKQMMQQKIDAAMQQVRDRAASDAQQ
jgi:ABC-type glycerol-3-phosphate transport system substrate-binding protein